jgi:hypothetical protein
MVHTSKSPLQSFAFACSKASLALGLHNIRFPAHFLFYPHTITVKSYRSDIQLISYIRTAFPHVHAYIFLVFDQLVHTRVTSRTRSTYLDNFDHIDCTAPVASSHPCKGLSTPRKRHKCANRQRADRANATSAPSLDIVMSAHREAVPTEII